MPAKMDRRGLDEKQFREMRRMLKQLTASERRKLADPEFITEDEADAIVALRRSREKNWVPIETVMAEMGLPWPSKNRGRRRKLQMKDVEYLVPGTLTWRPVSELRKKRSAGKRR